MPSTPWLLDPQNWENSPTPRDIRFNANRELGYVARFFAETNYQWPTDFQCPTGITGWQLVWRQCLARELLLLGLDVRPDLASAQELHDIHPFPGTLVPLALWGAIVTTCLVPVDSTRCPHGLPQLSSVWCWGPAKQGKYALITTSDCESYGGSWELALGLAEHALTEDEATRIRLAAEWVATGCLSGDNQHINPIKLGNKPALLTQIPSRAWLLPAANRPNSRQPATELFREFLVRTHHYFVATVDAAGHIFSNSGTIVENGSPLLWPTGKYPVFHGIVGHALGPLLASILLTQPKEVYLWHYHTMDTQLVSLVEILKERCPDLRVYMPSIVAEDIQSIAHCLRKEPTLSHQCLFNITSGNLLQRLAILDIARVNPELRCIYHELHTPEFITLRYEAEIGITGKYLLGQESPYHQLATLTLPDDLLPGVVKSHLRSVMVAFAPPLCSFV